jgi:hypothetical protein
MQSVDEAGSERRRRHRFIVGRRSPKCGGSEDSQRRKGGRGRHAIDTHSAARPLHPALLLAHIFFPAASKTFDM